MFVSEVWGMNLITATISQVGSIANSKSSERFENHWRSKYYIPAVFSGSGPVSGKMQIIMTGNGIFLIYMLLNFTFILLHFFSVERANLHLTVISFCEFFFSHMLFLTKNGILGK